MIESAPLPVMPATLDGPAFDAYVADALRLTVSQRSMIAARLVGLGMKRYDASFHLAVSVQQVSRATRILTHGTPEQIAAVDAGKMPVNRLYENALKGLGTKQTGVKTQAQVARAARMHGGLDFYRNLTVALDALTSMPRASDVVAIVAGLNTQGRIDAKVERAALWLMEFEHEWRNRRSKQTERAAGPEGEGGGGADHPGHGSKASGA